MNYEVVDLEPEHAYTILRTVDHPLPLSDSEIVSNYLSPGSISRTVMCNGVPLACGGIINLKWNRGEAWLLVSKFARHHIKGILRAAKIQLPEMARVGGFRRVQATVWCPCRPKLYIRRFGFNIDGFLPSFGPDGETAQMFSRIFA
jgi:hypothetical protein